MVKDLLTAQLEHVPQLYKAIYLRFKLKTAGVGLERQKKKSMQTFLDATCTYV